MRVDLKAPEKRICAYCRKLKDGSAMISTKYNGKNICKACWNRKLFK